MDEIHPLLFISKAMQIAAFLNLPRHYAYFAVAANVLYFTNGVTEILINQIAIKQKTCPKSVKKADSGHVFCSQTIIALRSTLDPRLCVPAFRQVCQ
jgi:hypothetical protein